MTAASSSRNGTATIRNIGVLAHVDAGKTSITEKMLYLAGLRREAGNVDEGTTATDYLSVERLHGITVKSAAVRFAWKDADVRLIDTPGHVDFGNEVTRALRILDGAVIALCAVSGVQARTEVIVAACARRRLPRLYFVNKMDRVGADFDGVVRNLAAALEPSAVAFQVPLFVDRAWVGVADLIGMRAWRFGAGEGGGGADVEAPLADFPESAEAVADARARLVERLAERDDAILSLYAENREVPAEVLAAAAALQVRDCLLAPVFCGSAFVDGSVGLLLDAVIGLLPSPANAAVPAGTSPRGGEPIATKSDPAGPIAAFVFKAAVGESGEVLAWTRVWSGTLTVGRKLVDARTSKPVSLRKIFGIQAESLIELGEAGPGEVVALRADGLEAGASLCDRGTPVVFEPLDTPEPVVSQVIEPPTLQDLAPLRRALEAMALEDLSLRVSEEKETGRFEVAGQGELHLDILVERLRREYGLRVRTGNPRVNLRERLAKPASAREDFDRDFGGERIRLSLALKVEPLRDGQVSEILTSPALKLTPPHLAAVRRGAEASLAVGPAGGWPMEATRLTLLEFAPPAGGTGRSGETAVEAATALAARRALSEAGSILLEPVMRVDIECPEEHFGPVLNALASRGGRVESVEDGLGRKDIAALAPMRRLFGFAGELRSMSRGRAQFQARFGGYEPCDNPLSH
ncbi:GTP-binding protein [bacterium]|nr:GTP-binding protein [bacterium]